jgi:crotonobetainyl-CoA:carnitine CoA-transferase CaiB-like acyl-CoA transferase
MPDDSSTIDATATSLSPRAPADPPLAGLIVLESATMFAGPLAGRILSDLGATVIKVEAPGGGDPCRALPPLKEGRSLSFLRLNANKESITIDLRSADGQSEFLRLVNSADVLIQAFRPATLEKWGLTPAAVRARNPQLVAAYISGYGQHGKYRDLPGFGTVMDGISGFASINGWPHDPPTVSPFGLADSMAGISAAAGILAGLCGAQRSGTGMDIDLALYEPLLVFVGDIFARYSALGVVEPRAGNNANRTTSPRGVFRTLDDRWVVIAGSSDSVVRRLFRLMGREEILDDERFRTNSARVAHNEILDQLVAEWVAKFDRSTVLEMLADAGVAAGPANDASDVVNDETLASRSLVSVSDPVLGKVLIPAPLIKILGRAPVSYGEVPELGEQNAKYGLPALAASENGASQ